MKIFDKQQLNYLTLLGQIYKNRNVAVTDIIKLKAVLNLPKGTEHFVSDIHGQYESFNHVLRNASGVIKNYISELFGKSLTENEKKGLATLIYYPKNKLEIVKQTEPNINEWYKMQLFRLVTVCKRVSSKYTRAKVRKSLPPEFAYILEELIHEDIDRIHKQNYYNEIINTIVQLERAEDFIIAISDVICRLAIEHLHVIGDIYDRGKDADKIMEILLNYHSVDVQWGNHDILWIGAASGSEACVCNAIRISARYDNLCTIEEGYGINLIPLATFALENYKGKISDRFIPRELDDYKMSPKESDLIARMHKAITVMQLKAEAEIIKSHPEYQMDGRLLLNKIDYENKTLEIDGVLYDLSDFDCETINPDSPYSFLPEEKEVLQKITQSFKNSYKLQQHSLFLINKGSMYTIYNDNLLFHGCIPLDENGDFRSSGILGETFSGKIFLDKIGETVRKGYFAPENSELRQNGLDLMWYLWCGSDSPLYGKNKMSVFESYFTDSKEISYEKKDFYYDFRENETVCGKILAEFGLDEKKSRIINGHVPVKVRKGESPLKSNGRLIVIDGGFAKAYQSVTGIAGYTLIYNSQGLLLASHEPFVSKQNAIENEGDIISSTSYIEHSFERKRVRDTDNGKAILQKISELEYLITAYKQGDIIES